MNAKEEEAEEAAITMLKKGFSMSYVGWYTGFSAYRLAIIKNREKI